MGPISVINIVVGVGVDSTRIWKSVKMITKMKYTITDFIIF